MHSIGDIAFCNAKCVCSPTEDILRIMKNKVKEKLAVYRVALSFTLIAIFSIIGWGWSVFFKVGYRINTQFSFAVVVLFLIIFDFIFVVSSINKLINKL